MMGYLFSIFAVSLCAAFCLRAAGYFMGRRAGGSEFKPADPLPAKTAIDEELYPAALVCAALVSGVAPVALWAGQAQRTPPRGFIAVAVFMIILCAAGLLAYRSGLFKPRQEPPK